MQLDMFSAPAASFRDQLLADQPAIGPDGATWKLVRWGQKGHQFWGFSRTAPGDISLAWTSASGIREHQDRIAAVDELEKRLVMWGDGWRQRDEEQRLNRARVAHDLFRIRCAVPEGWRWSKWGLLGESYTVQRPYVRDEARSPTQTIYPHDLYRDEGHADRIIASMSKWVWPPVAAAIVEDDVDDVVAADADEQMGMAL